MKGLSYINNIFNIRREKKDKNECFLNPAMNHETCTFGKRERFLTLMHYSYPSDFDAFFYAFFTVSILVL